MSHKIYNTSRKHGSQLWLWEPKPDISSLELAMCMPVLSSVIDSGTKGHSIEDLPDEAKRHFVKVG